MPTIRSPRRSKPAGERREAIEVTKRALEVLAKQELTHEQRRDMAGLLEARLKRLK